MNRVFFLFCLASVSALGSTPYPDGQLIYPGKIEISRVSRRSQADATQVVVAGKHACLNTHRALYAIENYFEEIRKLIGGKGVNFPVLFENKNFFEDHLRKRYEACSKGSILLRFYGKCGTERGTVAFVRVTLGYVHSSINICDEYFALSKDNRIETLIHEYGRLEDIGDSPNFDTNNIYVWDAIIRSLSDPNTFAQLEKLSGRPR